MALLLGCVATVNLLIDPYRVFGTPDLQGLTAVKPDFVEHLRLTTPYAIERVRPQILLLGTSRVGRGLSTSHPALKGLRTYNAALPAVSLYEAWRTLQHANVVNPLRVVVLGLDNRMFYADTDGQGAFSERRMAVDSSGARQRNPFAARLPDYASSLVSTDALLSSARVVRYQGWARLSLEPNGQWVATTNEFDSYHGFRAMTRNTLDRYRRYASGRFDMTRAAEPLREILRLCHRQDIELRMFIPPAHAWHWEAMRLMRMTARFDEIRREIVRVNAEVAAEFGRKPFPVLDFSGYRGPNIVPAPKDPSDASLWYAESVHFTPTLGGVVLDELMADRVLENGFGQPVGVENIESHLTRWHADRMRYVESNPDEAQDVVKIFQRWRTRQLDSAHAASKASLKPD